MLFMFFVFLGSLLSLSASSWIVVWLGLELNLMCFVVFMYKMDSLAIEAMVKYFLVQAGGSLLLIVGSFGMSYESSFSSFMNIKTIMFNILFISLLIKLGAAPFHFWFPNVLEGLEWIAGFMLMSWQKLAPMGVMLFFKLSSYNSLIFISMMGMLVGAVGGLNQVNLKKLMAFSSIGHLGWMFAALFLMESFFILYFMFYCFMSGLVVLFFYFKNYNYLIQLFNEGVDYYMNFILIMVNILSLGGLPPFMGFFSKWMIFFETINNYFILSMVMIFSSLLTLYYYFRVAYLGMLISSGGMKTTMFMMGYENKMLIFMSMFSLLFFMFMFAM